MAKEYTLRTTNAKGNASEVTFCVDNPAQLEEIKASYHEQGQRPHVVEVNDLDD